MNSVSHIIEVSLQNFQAEVVETSQQTPVLLEFYAPGAAPSDEMAPVLQRLVDTYGGKFRLARVNIQENQQLVQQMGIRTLPTLILVFQGQMVKNLEGPQEEAEIRELLDQVTMSPVERVRQQLSALIDSGQTGEAINLLQQMLVEEPANQSLKVELCDLLIMNQRLDEARQLLASLPLDTEEIHRPRARLSFLEESAVLPPREKLTEVQTAEPDNVEAMYQLAVVLVAANDVQDALNLLLKLMQKDREFGDDLARKTMIRVFEMLGKGHPLATEYRRKMFTYLH